MSAYSGPYRSGFGESWDRNHSDGHHGCGHLNWRPYELVAMIAGFALFWPVGLGILFFKIWQRKHDDPRDLASVIREKWHSRWEQKMGSCGSKRDHQGFSAYRMRSSGNVAFDDWRGAELARLEEEHQKLVAAEREFHDFMENLRRAKDKEEFDRFMAARRNWQQDQGSSDAPTA